MQIEIGNIQIEIGNMQIEIGNMQIEKLTKTRNNNILRIVLQESVMF